MRLAEYRQLVLFEAVRDFTRLVTVPEPGLVDFAESLEAVAVEHAEIHGWTVDVTGGVRRALRLLVAIQDTAGAPIKTSEVEALREIRYPVGPTLQVLAAAEALEDDRVPAVVGWFEARVQSLPEPMAAELRLWFAVMREGSAVAPRARPRSDRTNRNHFTYALPVLRGWAEHHTSLREIDRAQVQAALASTGPRRSDTLQGLRSVFRILKSRKQIFADPPDRIFCGTAGRTVPEAMDAAALRQALFSGDPVRAALTGLLAFHGLRPRQLRELMLTDVRDQRIMLGDRAIPLAEPVAIRVAAYLDYRARRWPATANPYLFINTATAGKTSQMHYKWVNTRLGFRAQDLREDRLLDEAHATSGDVRRLCDLFGITVGAAQRYVDAFLART
ncbi:hypothetical protein ABZV58_29110 [Nocardia sp. NPDC004654]|uniref:hypothetical protein n=1 Tax=Nocardia sp. NPDC004654 TaxID=3154776 RepID=UPI0033AF2D94